ncbi:MAG: ribonucleoside-diphosphate reductase subunit alpha [Rhodocyclaceae bacterium]|nr:ribonucleoside-diphosphate reductase subunit alpha [Rhodocyclaceae bacterium]
MERASDAIVQAKFQVIRRQGEITAFKAEKIALAITKAFVAVEGAEAGTSPRVRELIERLTHAVVRALTRRLPDGGAVHIEDIQDQVELALMRAGCHDVARAYVLYREKRAAERAMRQGARKPLLHIVDAGGRRPLCERELEESLARLAQGLAGIDVARVVAMATKNFYDGMSAEEVDQALILSARSLIELDPDYSFLSARLLLKALEKEVYGAAAMAPQEYFPQMIQRGIDAGLLDARLAEFDLERLAAALKPERDLKFGYLGLQTLYDRYFLHIAGRRIETPQPFFMRVAMGLAINEIEREARTIEFYDLLSSFDFMSSTPTLFNSGTRHPQLSSCYVTTVSDDLDSIFSAIKENALLQKYAGGLGNDWTPVRALGSPIRGTNGVSQGVIPFLKVVNDTAVAVNQGGKRKGAVCAYLETWHLDIEEFIELRKNTGDERRRCHDMNTAHWIPDLFMQRVLNDAEWTLFSPYDVPDLHDKYGRDFASAYKAYEAKAERGEIGLYKKVRARDLWRRMLTMLYETGHPWIVFKDPCNLRSPQRHAGVVHSSNLCTEITLNTSESETAVCNLGSVNLAAHLKDGALDHDKLRRTIRTAMRMLDNVIDINYYASPKARRANLRHRPVGLGVMGFADCLMQMGIPYASQEAVEFADRAMEAVCYYAYWASTELAEERGRYQSFAGSDWSQGILPHETVARLREERGGELELDDSTSLDWEALRERVLRHGMRNSNCVAVAPTATIANIVGVFPSIEPIYQNLYVKSNLSGEFTLVNPYLVAALEKRGLWDEVMVADLKYFDGQLSRIERVPEELKRLYATAFEIDSAWLVEAAARRQKWIDQAQSLNLYLAHPSGKQLDALYKLAWRRGLKSTYYLRTLGASQVEKHIDRPSVDERPSFCAIDDGACSTCQ